VKKFVDGFNVTVFAYGQTGSGKTYSMEGYQYKIDGDKPPKVIASGEDPGRLGIVPRVVQNLFQELKSLPASADSSVSVSFLQLYKERIYDLLNPAQAFHPNAPGLKMRWNKSDQFYVEDLSVHRCETISDVMRCYHTGLRSKVMSSHLLNSASSRSHCVFTLSYESQDKEEGGGVVSHLHLVDLAGSERTALTGNEGEALKDSIDINKSLFTLRQVISQLAGKDAGAYIPYRDSKLTSLLKQSVGGNSYCLMLACVSPADAFYDENLSTLAYATKASFIANDPVKNIDAKTKLVRGLKREIADLRTELTKAYQQIEMLSDLKREPSAPQQESRAASTASYPRSSQATTRPTTTNGGTQTAPSFESFTTIDPSFSLSPELLTEKLHDSVNLIRELISANRKLRSSITDISEDKSRLEEDVHHVYFVLQAASDR
jgi:kinesin family protein 4/21/27